MGTVRSRPPANQQSSEASEEEIAAAIAAVLAGAIVLPPGVTPLAAVAALLRVLPGVSGDGVTDAAARLVAGDVPSIPDGTGALNASRRAYLDNLIYRAHYAVNAAKRIGASVQGGEDLRGALRKEARYLAQHREANRRREAASKMVDAAVELHGPLLGWRHGDPKEPRPTHKAADGWNFDARRVPVSTAALPGVLPGCTCTVSAPIDGAPTLR